MTDDGSFWLRQGTVSFLSQYYANTKERSGKGENNFAKGKKFLKRSQVYFYFVSNTMEDLGSSLAQREKAKRKRHYNSRVC